MNLKFVSFWWSDYPFTMVYGAQFEKNSWVNSDLGQMGHTEIPTSSYEV